MGGAKRAVWAVEDGVGYDGPFRANIGAFIGHFGSPIPLSSSSIRAWTVDVVDARDKCPRPVQMFIYEDAAASEEPPVCDQCRIIGTVAPRFRLATDCLTTMSDLNHSYLYVLAFSWLCLPAHALQTGPEQGRHTGGPLNEPESYSKGFKSMQDGSSSPSALCATTLFCLVTHNGLHTWTLFKQKAQLLHRRLMLPGISTRHRQRWSLLPICCMGCCT